MHPLRSDCAQKKHAHLQGLVRRLQRRAALLRDLEVVAQLPRLGRELRPARVGGASAARGPGLAGVAWDNSGQHAVAMYSLAGTCATSRTASEPCAPPSTHLSAWSWCCRSPFSCTSPAICLQARRHSNSGVSGILDFARSSASKKKGACRVQTPGQRTSALPAPAPPPAPGSAQPGPAHRHLL